MMENKKEMTGVVLQTKAQIDQARFELRRHRLSCISSGLLRFLRRIGIRKGIEVGDEVKSWDVLNTTRFIEKNAHKNSPILDIGAYASEMPCILHRMGYANLTGVDLNPDIRYMPYADKIRYVVSNFMHTPFDNGSFEVITSTSVIEHGFNGKALLSEISRLLRPGGYFIASFDYWPEKIDTTGISFFGMDWKIFSEQEVLAFIQEAAAYRLTPRGAVHLQAQDHPITCAKRSYTFAWLALRKNVASNG
jgi:SAM-dependent methyltransferase